MIFQVFKVVIVQTIAVFWVLHQVAYLVCFDVSEEHTASIFRAIDFGYLKANSHIPCRVPAMPCRQKFGLCRSHLFYTAQLYLIHTCQAVPLPCSDHAALNATFQGHGTVGTRHSMCELTSTVFRRPLGHLPGFGFFGYQADVLQNAGAFWDVFNLLWRWWRQQIRQNYSLLWTNLKLKPIFLLLLWHISIVYSSFQYLCATTASSFQIS
jgi:hypothetical protein